MSPQDPPSLTPEIRQLCESYVDNPPRVVTDSLAPEAAAKLAVLLGVKAPARFLPPTWHWAYFNPGIPAAHQGHDLHEELGRFLPPAPFSRRMWAAGDVRVTAPLRLGLSATRTSRVRSVAFKSGKSGALCFVTVGHDIEQAGAPCISEDQVIVYRDRGAPEPALRDPGDPVPEGYAVHDDAELFFYSCITHNGHRIHWDRSFCRDVEGYPDLVVHGPLMATKLCDALRGQDTGPLRFRYRALAPVFATTPVRLHTGPDGDGWIERSDGVRSMQATLER